MLIQKQMMRDFCWCCCWVLMVAGSLAHAGVANVPKIKDPIFPDLYCSAKDVRWQENQLVTDLDVALLSCEQSGYLAFVFGQDALSEAEVDRIRQWLLKLKADWQVTQGFDFFAMSLIDQLWILKNIYERRDLSPQQHAQVYAAMRRPVQALMHELETEQALLEGCNLSNAMTRHQCHVLTIQHRLYETSPGDPTESDEAAQSDPDQP